MEVTLYLKPEVEARLVRQAQAQGVTIKQLLEQMIERLAALNESETPVGKLSTTEEWLAALNQLGKSPSLVKAPPLSTANEKIGSYELFAGYKHFAAAGE